MRTLLYYIRAELKAALDGIAERVNGKDVVTPCVPVVAPLLLSQVLAKWSAMGGARSDARPETVDEVKKALDAPIVRHGDLPVSVLTKQHGIALREHYQAKGNASGTIRKSLGLVNAVLAFAVREDYIPAHPFKGIQLPKGKKANRRTFSTSEWQTLFAHPGFTSGSPSSQTCRCNEQGVSFDQYSPCSNPPQREVPCPWMR